MGLESAGKSLKLAMDVVEVAYRNSAWRKASGIARPIVANTIFQPDFKLFVEKELEVPVLTWSETNELPDMKGCDLFIDELGRYFDARLWVDLSPDVRGWIGQAAKLGVEIYSASQNFEQVDVSYRRLVNNLYEISKLFGSPRPTNTRPPVKNIWGVCLVQEYSAQNYKEAERHAVGLPSFFFIERRYCDIFDTTQMFKRPKPLPYEHIDRECRLPDCHFHKISHV